MAQVRIEGVKKYFGNVKALDGINLKVNEGEFLVLLGPSGCGKTTLLRCIAGLEQVSAGKIFFDDREVTNFAPKDRNISMVFQSYAVWPHMKVRENISYPLKLKKVPKEEIEKRVNWAADLLNISELLDRYPAQLSGGQRQRVAVARAIVHEPHVLLMDEPLSNLDALLRVKMRSELKKLQERLGVTTIYVTHDQTEAMTMGDRIAVMNKGKIQQVGTPSEIYHHPVNIFVAGFVGSPQMNFLEMMVKSEGSKIVLKRNNITIPVKINTNIEKVIFGIRPENIYIEEKPNTIKLEGEVYFSEKLMSDTILHLNVGNDRIVAKIPGDVDFKSDEKITFFLDLEKIHLFHPETGERVS
ncbi:MAG TPA: ABC transporter ATP-binding protein [Thermotoga sp.]|nr:ABC transporter ATP-binding protein [Thermotoga sp.]